MVNGPGTREPAHPRAQSRSEIFAAAMKDHYRQVLDLKLPDRIFAFARRLTVRRKASRRTD